MTPKLSEICLQNLVQFTQNFVPTCDKGEGIRNSKKLSQNDSKNSHKSTVNNIVVFLHAKASNLACKALFQCNTSHWILVHQKAQFWGQKSNFDYHKSAQSRHKSNQHQFATMSMHSSAPSTASQRHNLWHYLWGIFLEYFDFLEIPSSNVSESEIFLLQCARIKPSSA